MRERRWPFGGMTTTPFDRTAHSVICRQPPTPKSPLLECNGTGRLRNAGASRPVPLHHRAIRAQMNPGLYSSADEAWGSGQVCIRHLGAGYRRAGPSAEAVRILGLHAFSDADRGSHARSCGARVAFWPPSRGRQRASLRDVQTRHRKAESSRASAKFPQLSQGASTRRPRLPK
jgi:hypothetical protein